MTCEQCEGRSFVIVEPGSTSEFDTYDFQEPTGVYNVNLG